MKDKNETQLAVIAEQILVIREDVKEIKVKLEREYVTNDRFTAFIDGRYGFIEKAVIGVIALIVTAVIYALLGLLGLKK